MRYLYVAALAVGALAFGATSAVAKTEPPNPHKFVGSPNAEPKVKGESETFTLKPFTVTCEKARSIKGGPALSFPSKTLTTTVKFSECEAEATVDKAEYELKAKFLTPVTFNFHANGAVEMGSGGTVKEGKLEGATAIEIALSGVFKCTIDVEPGIYPIQEVNKPEAEFGSAKYTNKEETIVKGKKSVLLKTLGITTALEKVPYELEGEFCEALPKTEFTNGQFEGSLVAEIKKGDISRE
jgi:hypothetical protein